MTEEEAVNVFDLAVKGGQLPAKMEQLVPLSFIGAAAVKFYQAKVKLMDQLGVTEKQRKATLADGQDAGEMLLDIEAKIGELYESAPHADRPGRPGGSPGSTKHDIAPKASPERQRMHKAVEVHRNPAAVAAIKKEAKENEDIPTKTAVLNKIKGDKAEAKLKAFRAQRAKEGSPLLDEYLEKSIEHLIQVNSLVKKFFDHPDQVEPGRMKELVRQVKILVDIISTKTGRESWKQLA